MNLWIGSARTSTGSPVRSRLAAMDLAPSSWLTASMLMSAARAADMIALVVAAVLVPHVDLGLGIVMVALCGVAVWGTGMAPGRLAPRVSDEIPYLLRNVALAAVVVGLAAGPSLPISEVVAMGVLVVGLVVVERALMYELFRTLRRRRLALEPVVVVGAGPTAIDLAHAIDEYPECGLAPWGFVDAEGATPPPATELPLLGSVADLAGILTRVGARHAIFAYGAARESEMVSTIRHCESRAHLYVLNRFYELGVADGSPANRADIAGYPVHRIHPPATVSPSRWAKRLIDVSVAAVLLLLFAPLMALVAFLVHTSSPGPIIFRQTRVGRDGTLFDILKFRTMTVNHDSDVTWSVSTDNRVTPIGRILRASHLDELPQLFNVLRGDMSLVGPRPERPFFVDQFGDAIDGYRDRHRVKSGMTGWSQVNGLVGDSSIEERARRDNWYIEHWSLWTDLLILIRTVPTMLRKRG